MKFAKLLSAVIIFSISFYLVLIVWIRETGKKTQPVLTNTVNEKREDDIAVLLPVDVYVRDVQIIPGLENSVLAIYIEPGYKKNSWDLSCPGMVLGDSIIGKYHLIFIKNGKLVNDLMIPPAYSHNEGSTELTFKNYKDGWPTENETKQKEVIKLMDLKDMTGDGKPYEFLLTTTAGGCGFTDGLVAGYDPGADKATLFSGWLPRFSPDNKGNYSYLFECGDHGNEIRVEEKYSFDSSMKKYKKVWEKETPCEP